MAQPKDRSRDADRGNRMLADTPYRSAHTENAFLVLLVIDCVAQFAYLRQLSAKIEHVGDGLARELSESMLVHGGFDLRLGEISHDGLANGSAISGVAASHARCQANAARRFDLVEIDNLTIVIHAEMSGFSGIAHSALQKRACPLAQVELADRFGSELKELQSEPILSRVGVLLDQPVPLQYHDQTVRGALVQLEHLGDLDQSEVGSLMREHLQQSQRSIYYLDLVGGS